MLHIRSARASSHTSNRLECACRTLVYPTRSSYSRDLEWAVSRHLTSWLTLALSVGAIDLVVCAYSLCSLYAPSLCINHGSRTPRTGAVSESSALRYTTHLAVQPASVKEIVANSGLTQKHVPIPTHFIRVFGNQ